MTMLVASPGSKALKTYMKHRKGFTRAMYGGFFAYTLLKILKPPKHKDRQLQRHSAPRKAAIDRKFLDRLIRILKVIFPHGIRSREFIILCAQTILLVVRTGLSLYIATLDGKITSHLVRGEGREFAMSLVWWIMIGFPASITNSLLAYLQKTLALRFRSRLTEHIMNRFLPASGNPVYYCMNNLDDRVQNADQIMTADVARFCNCISLLYANLTKPLLDMVLYTWKLGNNIGGDNVFFISLAIQISAALLRKSAPPFGEFVAKEASLEGSFRASHSRLMEFSEEIALYDGFSPEKDNLDRSFFALIKHANRVLRHRLRYHFLESFVVKYYWGALGMLLCSIPVFFNPTASENMSRLAGERSRAFVTNRRLLLSSSDAFGRIMSSYKDISQLAGYTDRVAQFLEVMTDMENSQFSKSSNLADEKEPEGIVRIASHIKFSHVPIQSPTGEVLVRDLCFEVKQGQDLLIVGPNGCGKSSLFRILGGLWKIHSGEMEIPPSSDFFYIPQRPYLPRGTLRQQIIYPTLEKQNKVSDEELQKILDLLDLGDIVENVGGWNTEQDWREEFSMGVQQRIAAARLFYHKPKFAILDECTSSVTIELETVIYTHAKSLGISLITVSHRASLWQYHNLILQFDGQGNYIFTDLNAEERLNLEKEKLAIDNELRQKPELEDRLIALEEQLAVA